MREREEIKAKVILEAKREIVQMLCCTPAFITCAPPRRCQRRRRQRHYVRIEEEKKGAKKKRFLLMNKGNFIFCLSFRMALTTLYSVMCYSFFFATICDRLQSRYGNGKRKKNRRNSKRESRKRNEKNPSSIAVPIPITIITWSIACIRFRLGKHVLKDEYQG